MGIISEYTHRPDLIIGVAVDYLYILHFISLVLLVYCD